MNKHESALDLIDRAYAAAVDPEGWGDLASALSTLFGGAAITLNIQPPGSRRPTATFHIGLDEERIHFAQSTSIASSAWLAAIMSDLGSRFIRIADHFPQDELPETEFAKDFLRPQQLAVESPILHLVSPEEGVLSSCVLVYRREGAAPISDELLAVADLLVPHLGRAIEIHSQLGQTEERELALHEVMDRLPTGVLILNSDSQPILVNRMAERILRSRDGLSFDQKGPVTSERKTTMGLRSLIESAIHPPRGKELAGGGFMALPRPSGRRDFPILITPVLGRQQSRRLADASVCLLVADPEFRGVDLSTLLTEVYRLTPAEAELVQLLVQGQTLEEAAGSRNVTLHTVRSQLKQIFAKTHTRRQSELLQLVLSSVSIVDEEPADKDG